MGDGSFSTSDVGSVQVLKAIWSKKSLLYEKQVLLGENPQKEKSNNISSLTED
jgi:hypothetical protein